MAILIYILKRDFGWIITGTFPSAGFISTVVRAISTVVRAIS